MKKAIVMLLSAALLMMALASCKVYDQDNTDVLVNTSGEVFDADKDYNLNGFTGDDDDSDAGLVNWGLWNGLTDLDGDNVVDIYDFNSAFTKDDFVSDYATWKKENPSSWDLTRG